MRLGMFSHMIPGRGSLAASGNTGNNHRRYVSDTDYACDRYGLQRPSTTLCDNFIAYTGIFKQLNIVLRLEGPTRAPTMTVADFLSHLHHRFAAGGPS